MHAQPPTDTPTDTPIAELDTTYRVYTDGAYADGLGGVGSVVFQGTLPIWEHAATYLNAHSAVQAELRALETALHYLTTEQRLRWQTVVCHLDNLAIVDCLTAVPPLHLPRDIAQLGEYRRVVQLLDALPSCRWQFVWVPREENTLAHTLAQNAVERYHRRQHQGTPAALAVDVAHLLFDLYTTGRRIPLIARVPFVLAPADAQRGIAQYRGLVDRQLQALSWPRRGIDRPRGGLLDRLFRVFTELRDWLAEQPAVTVPDFAALVLRDLRGEAVPLDRAYLAYYGDEWAQALRACPTGQFTKLMLDRRAQRLDYLEHPRSPTQMLTAFLMLSDQLRDAAAQDALLLAESR